MLIHGLYGVRYTLCTIYPVEIMHRSFPFVLNDKDEKEPQSCEYDSAMVGDALIVRPADTFADPRRC